jgi:hypothetical protein
MTFPQWANAHHWKPHISLEKCTTFWSDETLRSREMVERIFDMLEKQRRFVRLPMPVLSRLELILIQLPNLRRHMSLILQNRG